MTTTPTKKRGRPATKKVAPQAQVAQAIKEVIKFVDRPELEGYELYKALENTGYFQGGSGYYIENPNGLDKVYVPTAPEVVSFFAGDPDKWELMRDGIIRAYIQIYEGGN